MKPGRNNIAVTRALLLVVIAVFSGGSDCTSCTVPNPNYRPRDAAIDAPPDATPAPHYHYVFNKVLVPTNQSQKDQYSLDLNGDGTVDNSVGGALVAIAGLGFDLQAAIDRAVLSGRLIGLADIQTSDFNNSNAVSMQFFLGSNPQPAACGAGEKPICTNAKPAVCTGCGLHLTAGTFSIAAGSPQHDAITGKIGGGTFNGGPGNLTLLISLGDADPIQFDLIGAKVKASGMTQFKVGAVSGTNATDGFVLSGALTQDSLDNKVIPGIQAQLNATVSAQCKGAPPDCGCGTTEEGKNAKSILDFLTLDPKDCTISVDEVKAKAMLLFRQDIAIEGKSVYSFGIRATGTKAAFAVPEQ